LGLHDDETLFEEHAGEVKIYCHTIRNRGRKKLPENLERRIVPHDISEEEKICSCGCRLENIGSEDSEQLVVIPPEVMPQLFTTP
jgi:transposase